MPSSRLRLRRPTGLAGSLGAALVLVAVAGSARAQSTQDDLPVTQGVPRFTPPVLLEKASADYPPDAARDGLEGTVVLEFVVDEKGAVGEVLVKQPAGHGFDEAAIAAIKRFRFKPGLYDNTPVPSKVTYAYRFTIQQVVRPVGPPVEEQVRVSGEVLARGTRAPLAGAQIVAEHLDTVSAAPAASPDPANPTNPPSAEAPVEAPVETRFEAETDADGRFTLRGLPDGRYKLTVTGAGIVAAAFDEELRPRQAITVRYFVDRTWSSRYQTVVRAQAAREEISRQTLTTEELVKMPGSFGDPLRAVENLPGVARAPFNTGLFIIRGGKPTDSRAFFAGAEVPQLYHFGGFTSVLPAHLIEKVDYLPGNFGVRYGRAIAGVVDIDIREGKKDRLHGYADVNAFDAGVAVEGPVGKGTFIIGARRSYVDAVLRLAASVGGLEGAPLSFVTAPAYYDYQAVLDYPLAGGKFRALLIGSDDQLNLLFNEPQGDPSIRGNFSTHLFFHKLQLRWQRNWGPVSFYVQNAAGYSGQGGRLGAGLDFDIGVFQDDTRLEARWKVSPRFKILAGADSQIAIVRLDAAVPIPPREGELALPLSVTTTQRADETLKIFNIGLYAEAVLQPIPKLTITPGIRFDWFGDVNAAAFDPRLAAKYQITPITAIKAGVGLYTQDPQPQDYQKSFGNPMVGPERALHYALSIEQGIMPGMMFEATGFYKQLFDLIAPSARTIQRDGQIVSERVDNNGLGRVYGGEFLIRQALSKWFFGWVAYTVMRSERRDCETCAWRLFDYDQTHVFILALHANLPRGFEVGVRFRYISGYPYTQVRGGYFDSDADVYAPGRFPVNGGRLGAYHQADIRFDKTFIFEKWLLKIYLDITNVYNHANPEQATYAYDYTKQTAVTGLPILPSFGVRGEF